MRNNTFALILAAGVATALPAFAADDPGTAAEPAPASEAEAAAEAPAALPPEATVVAPVAAPEAEIDLASLGLDTGQVEQDDALRIYGFADVTFTVPMMKADSLIAAASNDGQSSFLMGSFNLYLAKNLSPKWRTLGEVRLLYTPNGDVSDDGAIANTVATDYSNFDRDITWGGIAIERLYLEYDVADWITVRAGRFLSPYGVWNVDHGSPVIIGVGRPYMIGEQLIPEHQTGIDVFGKKFFGDYGLSYHLTVTNGRGPVESVQDLDGNKALGGRLELSTRWIGQLNLGVSGYVGTYTDREQDSFTPKLEGGVTVTQNLNSRYDEQVLGADFTLDRGGFHAQGEVMYRAIAFDESGRAKQAAGFVPDSSSWGAYGLLGYRFDWLGMMPFLSYEHFNFPENIYNNIVPRVHGYTLGVNLRPTPATVLKVVVGGATFPGAGALLKGDYYLGLFTQAAWAF